MCIKKLLFRKRIKYIRCSRQSFRRAEGCFLFKQAFVSVVAKAFEAFKILFVGFYRFKKHLISFLLCDAIMKVAKFFYVPLKTYLFRDSDNALHTKLRGRTFCAHTTVQIAVCDNFHLVETF